MIPAYFFRWVLVFGVLTMSGCDFVYRLLQKEGAEEREILGAIVPMESNAQVKKVQTFLKLYGYNIGNPDGILGTNTRISVGKFQEDNQLKVTRFVDKVTWEQMMAYETVGFIKDDKLNYATVQGALKAAGYEIGKIDGHWGRKTQTAIRSFQIEKGLHPDGRVGLKTMQALAQYLE